jgi:glycosyltransferase involved in cell wall biosynthesis
MCFAGGGTAPDGMRILFVIRSLQLGGAERQCTSLAANLRKRGYVVCVVSLAAGGVLAPELVRHDVDVRTCDHRGPFDLARSALRLRGFVREFAPDVIYSFMSVSNILCAICLPRSMLARLVWGVRASWADHPDYSVLARLVMKIETKLARRPRLIISNSLAGANYHIGLGYPRERTRVVENAIDDALFDFSEPARKNARSRLGVAEGRKIVVLVARIDVIKGYDTFLDAAAQVAARRGDVDFWCVGGGNSQLAGQLRNRARALNIESRVTWHGEVRETKILVELLAAADLAVSASMAEGFPNSVAECLVCGLPVIGTDAGDTRRIIGDSGDCVPIGDKDAMAAAILRRLELNATRESVRADYLARFAPPLLLERHEALLLGIADGAGR